MHLGLARFACFTFQMEAMQNAVKQRRRLDATLDKKAKPANNAYNAANNFDALCAISATGPIQVRS
jgi:hypothetical protein